MLYIYSLELIVILVGLEPTYSLLRVKPSSLTYRTIILVGFAPTKSV